MNGKTVEVLNTDAEGRLILADALSYAARHKPAAVVDIATLTGAWCYCFGTTQQRVNEHKRCFGGGITNRRRIIGDTCWRLPLGEEYQKQLKSDYADMPISAVGGRGQSRRLVFLSQFVECPAWAHLDIAGTAWDEKKRATGRPLPLLLNFLMRRAEGCPIKS